MPESGPPHDLESWQRSIFETLRRIDGRALFWVGLIEIDFRALGVQRLEDFPADALVADVDAWLMTLDPNADAAEHEWTGGGVRLRFRAKGRREDTRGWTAMPSFNLLDQQMDDLHFIAGERRQFVSLSLDDVEALARGATKVVGQGASYRDTFEMLAKEMRHFGLDSVADMHPTVITAYAGQLGLVEPPPSLGNFEAGWRDVFRQPPND